MHDFPLISTIAAGFAAAWVLGLLTQWLRLSPIVGYLLAGVVIGPYSPLSVGDPQLAHQLAEIGVILLMFGVGLHFHIQDLMAVKSVAIPGAIGQSLVATLCGVCLFMLFGMEVKSGIVVGMAMAVASTVVLMRVLIDAGVLDSPQGHIAVGWLLVEDVLTVVVLVLIPVLGGGLDSATEAGWMDNPAVAVGIAMLKLVALVAIVIVAGSWVIPRVLVQVARLRSRELFTLTVMVFSIAIAAGAYVAFGASMALGAFLAGMVVAQSPVSHQAAADALPLRDAFSVLFFVSVGMHFDPMFLVQQPLMMLAALGIILVAKPLAALIIVAVLGHSSRTALTVSLGLAQIGEFSFILSEVAQKNGLMPDAGHHLLVGGAIISITLNPILFRSIDGIEQWISQHPRLWKLLNARAMRKAGDTNVEVANLILRGGEDNRAVAVIVGFGPVGRSVDRMLRDADLDTVVIDMNMDTVSELTRQGRRAIFGDASRETILEMVGLKDASYLVLTLPQANHRTAIVSLARSLNPRIKVFVRARYLREQEELEQVGTTAAIYEEAEAAVALTRLVLADTGAGRDLINRAALDIRMRLILENVSSLRAQPIRNIMIPWSRVRRLSSSASLDEVRREVGDQHFSRWPVVESSSSPPIGYLLAKDLIGHNAGVENWTSLVRPLDAVAPDDDVESTLLYFQGESATMCVVLDQGSPVGLVTLEDILEQVVGRIEDEYPRRPRVHLRDVLWTDPALLDLAAATSEQAIMEMAALIPQEYLPRNANVKDLILARERELPTSVGFGVAIPHARCPGLSRPVVVFGRSVDGVDFHQPSSDLVHLILLLVTPLDEPDIQVLLLGQLAGFAGSAEIRGQLMRASSPTEVRDVLSDNSPDGSLEQTCDA